MLSKHAFVHWYTGEGMEDMELTEARANMADLITECQQCAEYDDQDDDEEAFGDEGMDEEEGG